jgi:hypothetical protein
MKFSDLFEEILNEGKSYSDEKFDRFAENAGWWLYEYFENSPSDIQIKLPGYGSYYDYLINNSKYSKDDLKTGADIVYTLPDYYKYWLNQALSFGESNKIMGKTIERFGLQDKMSGKDSSSPKKRGRKPKPQDTEPQADDAMAHFNQATEKKRRGRPPVPDELKKRYVPTGLPRGRKPKVRDAEAEPEFTLEPTDEPVKTKKSYYVPTGRKSTGRPPKYEPPMVDTRIKTLEDRIASLEALLREKGILEEQRTLLESRLRMMKDYRKFL